MPPGIEVRVKVRGVVALAEVAEKATVLRDDYKARVSAFRHRVAIKLGVSFIDLDAQGGRHAGCAADKVIDAARLVVGADARGEGYGSDTTLSFLSDSDGVVVGHGNPLVSLLG